ncbi:5-oxoprolinase subunit B family protein [Mycobacterium spongiae]|uniref:Carboxyltransferase domain-containing protein n=1 Tax=Mycobacterium spongiae TaxID=886343 RepID=A0A975JUQ8_9MYCO|nr:allophanate hydrolase subunit 1 [Mycobacterium spongiae]QUR66016.1 carboxyltransferase domain-containing protein [Mycobacterium spongiae]
MSVMDISQEASVAATVLDYGDQALLLQCNTTGDVLAWTDAVREAALPGVVDIVPAAATVLLKLAGPRWQGVTRQRLRRLRVTADMAVPAEVNHRREVVIDVIYDGPDLADVAHHTGLTTAQVINAHTATPWRVGFNGFAPGFAYLIDGDPRLRVPRRAEPRTAVPAGSVALASEFSAVYPGQSPGGWQIIGHTDAVLWDLDRPEPALLTRGTWVQFRAA